MKKSELRQMIREEVRRVNEWRYGDVQRPKNLIKKVDYSEVIPEKILNVFK